MNLKQFYEQLLRLKDPWYVDSVEVDEQGTRVDVYVKHHNPIRVACPVCKEFLGMYDHTPERIIEHLNTCQMRTFVHIRHPRVKCPEHGIKQILSELGEPNSHMTFAFESHILDLAKECSIAAVSRLSALSWDESPFIAATRNHIPDASKKIVFDRFHVMGYATDAVDKVRKEENARLKESGNDMLVGTKYLWDFQSEIWARKFFKKWHFWATHSRLEPMIKAANTIKNHFENVVAYVHHHITNAVAEGLNNKIEKVKRMAYGYRNRAHYRAMIYFHCGGLDLIPKTLTECQIKWAPA